MAFPTAAGVPSYSGTFIPEIWSGMLLDKFYDATVLASISNTKYEGEIKKQGDKVIIRTIPSITIRDYVKGQTLTTERPESPNVELLIDKGKYFNFVIDDVDKAQSDLDYMQEWSRDASTQMKIQIDTDVLGAIYSSAHADNAGATAGRISGSIGLGAAGAPLAVTAATVLNTIVDVGSVLNEQNVPQEGRFLVVPDWFSAMIQKSDLRNASFTGTSDSGNPVLRNGRIGMIGNIEIYNSNLLTHAVDTGHDSYHIIGGQKTALTFASQLTEVETLRVESSFGNVVRGLQIFGYEVIKPEALVHLYAYKG